MRKRNEQPPKKSVKEISNPELVKKDSEKLVKKDSEKFAEVDYFLDLEANNDVGYPNESYVRNPFHEVHEEFDDDKFDFDDDKFDFMNRRHLGAEESNFP